MRLARNGLLVEDGARIVGSWGDQCMRSHQLSHSSTTPRDPTIGRYRANGVPGVNLGLSNRTWVEERYQEFGTIFLPSYLPSDEITVENQVGSGARAAVVLLRLRQGSLSPSGDQILS